MLGVLLMVLVVLVEVLVVLVMSSGVLVVDVCACGWTRNLSLRSH